MADLIESLRPFLRGIEELNFGKQLFTVKAGEHERWKPDKAGWLVDFSIASTSPLIAIEHNFWGQKLSYNLYQAYTLGNSLYPNNAVQWFTKYDTVNSVYTMFYTPRPYDYYTNIMYIDIKNETGSDISVISILIHYLSITDVNELKKSIQEVLSK